jgi:DNA-binding beta-propeller fold protein YncE
MGDPSRAAAAAAAQGGLMLRALHVRLALVPAALPAAALSAVALLAVAWPAIALPAAAANPIAAENALPGTTGWRLTAGARGAQLEGYADATSVNHGAPIGIYLRTDGQHTVHWSLYRLGYYGGLGGRLIESGGPVGVGPQPTPAARRPTGLVECRWPVSFILQTQPWWVSGFYLLKLTREDGRQNHVIFVVRADERKGAAVFQAPVTTWQAYNTWGGESLYVDSIGLPGGHAREVSFNRPYADLLNNYVMFEQFAVLRLESRGYDLVYVTNVDMEQGEEHLQGQRLFLSVAHDEYWTRNERRAVEAAVGQGVNVAFLSANSSYWQIRLEPSRVDGTPARTEVSYKDEAAEDPLAHTNLITQRWRDRGPNAPENELLGVMYSAWDAVDAPYVVRGAQSWVYHGTGLHDGDTIPLLVGYESDRTFDNGWAPPGLTVLSSDPAIDHTGAPEVHNATVYTARSGAFVFASGTIQWSWGLASPGVVDARVQRITDNLFARAGLTPALPGDSFGAGRSRPIDWSRAAASVTTLAGLSHVEGHLEGPAAGARFQRPTAIAADAAGNLFVTDTGNHRVRLIANDAARTVTTIAGTGAAGRGTGPGLRAALNRPTGIALGPGGAIFVTDTGNNRIVRIGRDPAWTVTTWAGSPFGAEGYREGAGTASLFRIPLGLAEAGGALFVAEGGNHAIRRIDALGHVSTVVGGKAGMRNGPGAVALLKYPTGIGAGAGALWVVDTQNYAIRRIALDGAYTTSTVAGHGWPGGPEDGTPSSARFMAAFGVALLGNTVLVADSGNSRIRALSGTSVTTFAGSGMSGGADGTGRSASFSLPTGLAVLPDGDVAVVDEGDSTVRLVRPR